MTATGTPYAGAGARPSSARCSLSHAPTESPYVAEVHRRVRGRGLLRRGPAYTHMAAVLRRKIDEGTLPVAIGDMATTAVPGESTLVYLVYNTITNLLTQDEQVECFRNAARHLTPGGRFVIELGVPPLRFLPPGQVSVPFDVSERHLGFDTFDLVEQILVSHHFTRDGDDGRYRRNNSLHRYAWPAELDLMARIAGLELERRVADWDGAPFTQDSAKHISVWRKPA
ncbi:SAM-dependent methyltransferase [Streptomyces sp. NPDC002896]|uniref:SAM-dependent methyltransferase n=1 Tax=Streptomyces sp. NPDC002896 TaxID=3154438 RepID=UPI003330930D